MHHQIFLFTDYWHEQPHRRHKKNGVGDAVLERIAAAYDVPDRVHERDHRVDCRYSRHEGSDLTVRAGGDVIGRDDGARQRGAEEPKTVECKSRR
jgi:hypothetical protein